jgi:hypothetical protein
MDMDQVELDAAYDQFFYAPLHREVQNRLASNSNGARAHPSHQGQQPPIGDPLGNPVEQALMMDPVDGSASRGARPTVRPRSKGSISTGRTA